MSQLVEAVCLFGAGGHGRATAEVIRRAGIYDVRCVVDDREPPGTLRPLWVGGRDELGKIRSTGSAAGFVAIGDNAIRAQLTTLMVDSGFEMITVIDPSAVVASDARIGAGSSVMPHALAGANATLGQGVIVNSAATVDHDCVVGDYVQISPGAHLTGGCTIGDFAFLGGGAIVAMPVTIGARTIVGAGAVVLNDLPADVVAVGTPARVLRVLDRP